MQGLQGRETPRAQGQPPPSILFSPHLPLLPTLRPRVLLYLPPPHPEFWLRNFWAGI